MAVQPAHDTPAADGVQERQPPGLVGAQPPAADQPGGRQRVFGYLDTASAGRYRQLMGVLLANKRRFGLRMTPSQIADRLWERFAARYQSDDELERDLAALQEWGAVDAHQDTSRAATTRQFKRRRFTYDITAAGEIAGPSATTRALPGSSRCSTTSPPSWTGCAPTRATSCASWAR
jgi:hypothetical protein